MLNEPLRVGPLDLHLTTVGPAQPVPEARLREGYTPPRRRAPGRRVELRVRHDAPPPRVDGLPSFVHRGGDAYEDDSGAWTATVRDLRPGGSPVADVRVRRTLDDPERWFFVLKLALRTLAATAAVLEDALLVHGCAMVPPDGGPAALFVGPSGHGKTTMTRRLPGWRVLGDDTVIVTPRGAGFAVAGTPFAGKEGLSRCGEPAPLGRILALRPGAERLELAPMGSAEAFGELVQRSFWHVQDGPLVSRVLERVEALVAALPVHRLASGLEHDVASALTERSREVA